MHTPKSRPALLSIALIFGIALGLGLSGCDSRPDASSGQGSEEAEGAAASGLARVVQIHDPYARIERLAALLPTLGPESRGAVEALLQRYPHSLGAAEYDMLVRFWALHAPRDAALWAIGDSAPRYRQLAVETAIETWAANDPSAALVAVETDLTSLDEEVSRTVEMALIEGWFDADRAGLERYIGSLGTGVKQQRALLAYAISLADADGSEALMDWADSVPGNDERYKLAVNRQVMSALSWADPPAALRFCDRHCEGPHGKGLRKVLIRRQLRDGMDGQKVIEWVLDIPAKDDAQRELKADSLKVAYRVWARLDREAALGWLEDRDSRPEADVDEDTWDAELYGVYARFKASEDPEEAVRWAERVDDDAEREHLLVRILRFWRTQDETAAAAWLDRSDLPERAKAAALDRSATVHLPNLPEDPGED